MSFVFSHSRLAPRFFINLMQQAALILFLWVNVGHVQCDTKKPEIHSFSVKDQLWLSVAKVTVSPAKEQVFTSKTAGVIKFIKGGGSSLTTGEVWAVDKPERLALSAESLRLEAIATKNKIFTASLDHQDKLVILEEKKDKLSMELKKLSALSTNPEFESDHVMKQKISEAKSKLVDELKRLDLRFNKLKSKSEHDIQIAQLELDEKKRKNEFLDIKRNSEHIAEFEGQLEFNIPISAGVTFPHEEWVEAGEVIATLTNDNHYDVTLAPVPPALVNIDPASFYVIVNKDSENREVAASFDRVIKQAGKLVSNQSMIFKVHDGHQAAAKRLQGSNLLAHVYTDLGMDCRIVPKTVIMDYFSESSTEQNWAFLVKSLWPECKLVAVGRNDLALLETSQN